jgi:hypothetical protein
MESMMTMAEQDGWAVRSLSNAKGAYNGVRWWAQRFGKKLAWYGWSGTVAFPEGMGGEAAEKRLKMLQEASARVAAGGEFGGAECRVWRALGLEMAYRGVGGRSPAVEVDRVPKERMVAFAKALCEASGESRAVVYEGGDILQSVEGEGEWEGETGEVWWVEKRKAAEEGDGPKAGESKETATDEIREAMGREARECGEWARKAGRVVVARVRVEMGFAPEGVFRVPWMKARKQPGWSGMMFALRWERKDGGMVAERVLAVAGASVEEVAELVDGVRGTTCREVRVSAERGASEDGWLEELFGERPDGEEDGEWSLVEAWKVEPPSPSVFGWHDRLFAVRLRETEPCEEKSEEGEG